MFESWDVYRYWTHTQQFTKAIALLFEGEKVEARIQRQYMERDMYDLCIDDGLQVVPLKGQEDWSRVQPGRKIVLRVILTRSQRTNVRRYKCPGCGAWNMAETDTSSIDWSAGIGSWSNDSMMTLLMF